MNKIGFKISKPNEDVNTATDVLLGYGDELNAFRIVKKSATTGSEQSHSLGYTPGFLAFSDAGYLGYTGEYVNNLSAYATDSTYLGLDNGYIVLLSNPAFNVPGTLDSNGLLQISEQDKNVLNSKSSEMAFDANYEQMQIHTVLDMTISLPEETVTDSITRTVTMAHGLNYLPIINPSAQYMLVAKDTINMNDVCRGFTYIGNFTMRSNKQVTGTITFDSTNVYFRVTRSIALAEDLFYAGNATASVTVFKNRLDEEVDFTQ